MDKRQRMLGAMWGLAGVVLVFGNGVVTLGARGIATIREGLAPLEWAALIALTVVFVYGEGVRALQRRWVPYVFSRLALLRTSDNVLHHLVAPLYAMALIGAPRRALVLAWAGALAIVLAVLIVSRFPPPWRGITDFAVSVALAWALAVMIAKAARLRARTSSSDTTSR
jgi:hypothetical protein